jgi:subtilisin family serine protease
MKRLSLVLLLAVVACSDPSGPVVRPPNGATFARVADAPTHIVWADAPGVATAALARIGVNPSVVWSRALHGAAAVVSPADSVALVSAGVRVTTNGVVTVDPSITRSTPSWGLDRIDQRFLPLDNSYSPPNEGAGVTVYIIDTGMEITHPEFGGRASNGADFIDGTFNPSCHYHATHVAGTVGGAVVGVANQVAIVSVRVLNCSGSGTWAQVISGIEWVTANAVQPAVANMSLGGFLGFPGTPENDPTIAAVENSIAAGTVYALSSGNSNNDACLYAPGAAPSGLTVNASDASDLRAYFTNSGPCTDLFAPGVNIYSAMPGGYGTLSGTSMSAPHVAGHAAQVRSANPAWTPAQVGADVLARATPNVITGTVFAGTPNLLLYTGTGAEEPPPPPPPPTECPPGTRLRGRSGKCR